MKLTPIKSAANHAAALARLDAIFDAPPGTPKADEAEILAALIQNYEEQHFPIDLPTPLEAIRFRMDQSAMRPKDLVPYLGSAARVSEVLAGRRSLSLAMIRNLTQLGIPVEVLIQDPKPKQVSPRRPARKKLLASA